MTDFAQSLREKTRKAIRDGEEEAERQRIAEKAADDAKFAEELRVSKNILEGIPAKCERAAAKGEYGVLVHRIKKADIVGKDNNGYTKHSGLERDDLAGVSLLVFEGCIKLGLITSVQYGYDGGGMVSWNDIKVEW